MQRSRTINFRASPQLAEVLAEAAEREGVTVSDLVRQAVENRVSQSVTATTGQRAAFDPFGKLSAAARGSLQAQRDLANAAAEMAFARNEAGEFLNDPETCLIEGLVLARLAAAQGDIHDQGLVIGLIALLAEVVGEANAEEQLGEALARLALVADLKGQACEASAQTAGDGLVAMVEAASAETVAMAKTYASRIKDKVFEK